MLSLETRDKNIAGIITKTQVCSLDMPVRHENEAKINKPQKLEPILGRMWNKLPF